MIRFRLAWLLLVLPPLLLQAPSPILNVEDGPTSSVGRIPAKGVETAGRTLKYAGLEVPGEFAIERVNGPERSAGQGSPAAERVPGPSRAIKVSLNVQPSVIEPVRASSECLPYDANAPPPLS